MPQLDQPRRLRILGSQTSERRVEFNQVVTDTGSRQRDIVECDAFPVPSMFFCTLAACGVDENAPHRLGGRGKEVCPAFPELGPLHIHEPHIRLVDKSGWLQSLPGVFLGQPSSRELLQFVVHERQQPVGRNGLAQLNLLQNLRDFGHSEDCKPPLKANPCGVTFARSVRPAVWVSSDSRLTTCPGPTVLARRENRIAPQGNRRDLSMSEFITDSLNQRYWATLALVAFLVLLNQLLVQPSLMRLTTDAPVINIAGRQRMLSQRLAEST